MNISACTRVPVCNSERINAIDAHLTKLLITDIVPGFFLVHAVDRHAGTYTVHSSSRILTTHAMHQSSSYDNDQLASSHVTNVTQLRNSETY